VTGPRDRSDRAERSDRSDRAQTPPELEEVDEAQEQDLRELYRQQVLTSIGGWSGMAVTALPTIVFVLVNSLADLRGAVLAAVASGALVAAYRAVRRQPLQQAATGLLGVGVAALIAWRMGEARGYFLLGIVSSFGYAAVFGVSLLIRRPLVGYLWEFLDPSPHRSVPWQREPILLRAYSWATFAAFLLFAARAAVQTSLFAQDQTGWLAAARLGMGYPLYIAVLGFVFIVCRRAHRRLEHELHAGRADGGQSAAGQQQS
jgi:hypothetical protein